MAQWIGQYTGRTHETKVAQIEGTMKAAVESLNAASQDDYADKLRSVEKLADRLLTARLKMLGAKIENLTEARSPDQYSQQAKNLMERESAASKGGITAILEEFGVNVPNTSGL